MMRLRLLALAATLAAALASPVHAQPGAAAPLPTPEIALPTEIDRVLRDFERAWAAEDEAGIAALFTEDGYVGTFWGWAVGRDTVRAMHRLAMEQIRIRAHAFAAGDSVGYVIGSFRFDESGRDTGNIIFLLRRAPDGRWMIAGTLSGDRNADPPPPPLPNGG
jgi:ketosteroid isomerase-like protein